MIKILSLLAAGLIGANSWAYLEVLDTGETLAKGHYKLLASTQFLTSTGGANVGVAADAGFNEEWGARVLAGFGRTDYFFGGKVKWIPIPDIQGGQPAVGFNVGMEYAKWNDNRDLIIRFEPLVSKKFALEGAILTPYAALPLGLRMRNSTEHDTATKIPAQFVVGSQVEIEKWKNIQFMGEIGLELDNSFSYISLAGLWYFDEESGFQVK